MQHAQQQHSDCTLQLADLIPYFATAACMRVWFRDFSQNLLEWSAIQGLVLVAKGRAAVLANVLQSMWLSPMTVPIIPRSVWVNMLALRFYAYSTMFLLKLTSTSVNVMCSSSAERMQGLMRGSWAGLSVQLSSKLLWRQAAKLLAL